MRRPSTALVLLLGPFGCGDEIMEPVDRRAPEIGDAVVSTDPNGSPGLALVGIQLRDSMGAGPRDVELRFRHRVDGRPQPLRDARAWLPVPEGTILEVQPRGRVEGPWIRDLAFEDDLIAYFLLDLRRLALNCQTVSFGARVAGSEDGVVSIGGAQSWPMDSPPRLEVEVEGDAEWTQTGDVHEIMAPAERTDSDPPIRITVRAPDATESRRVTIGARFEGAREEHLRIDLGPRHRDFADRPNGLLWADVDPARGSSLDITFHAYAEEHRICVLYWSDHLNRPGYVRDMDVVQKLTVRVGASPD